MINPLADLIPEPPKDPRVNFSWATVESLSPLHIRWDGEALALPIEPDTIVKVTNLQIGDRVLGLHLAKQTIIIGKEGGTSGGPPLGTIEEYSFADLPDDGLWLWARGGTVLIEDYPEYAAKAGTIWGGNGTTTVGLPDRRGRVGAGYDATQIEFNALGKLFGAKTHTITTAQLAIHSHQATAGAYTLWAASGVGTFLNGPYYGGQTVSNPSTGNAGSGQAHNNIQPTVAMNYIVKVRP